MSQMKKTQYQQYNMENSICSNEIFTCHQLIELPILRYTRMQSIQGRMKY